MNDQLNVNRAAQGNSTPGAHRAHGARGLCGDCRWARQVVNRRGSEFLLCGRQRIDPRFRKYPPLPVLSCAGFERGEKSL